MRDVDLSDFSEWQDDGAAERQSHDQPVATSFFLVGADREEM